MSDIRDLVESYYNDVYIEEEVLDEQGGRLPGPAARKLDAERRMQANVQRAQAPTPPPSGRNVRGGSGRYQSVAADKGAGGDAAYRAGGGDAAARGGLTRQQIQQKGMAATRAAAAKPDAPAPAPKPDLTPDVKPVIAPARPLPAGKPNLNVKVTAPAPAAVGKVAPTAPARSETPAVTPTPAKRPSISQDVADLKKMQQASQMRQKGANVTSDMISDKSVKVPTPVPQMSARAQALKAGGPSGGPRERR